MKIEIVKFIHSDGKQYAFKYGLNKLTKDYLYTFDDWKSCYVTDLGEINRIIKRLPKN